MFKIPELSFNITYFITHYPRCPTDHRLEQRGEGNEYLPPQVWFPGSWGRYSPQTGNLLGGWSQTSLLPWWNDWQSNSLQKKHKRVRVNDSKLKKNIKLSCITIFHIVLETDVCVIVTDWFVLRHQENLDRAVCCQLHLKCMRVAVNIANGQYKSY